jgi:hypothetical protein
VTDPQRDLPQSVRGFKYRQGAAEALIPSPELAPHLRPAVAGGSGAVGDAQVLLGRKYGTITTHYSATEMGN